VKAVKIGFFVVGVLAACLFTAWQWMGHSVATLRARVEAETAAVRAERAAARRPVLRGEPRAGVNAAVEYREVMKAIGNPPSAPTPQQKAQPVVTLGRLAADAPAPLPGWALAYIDLHRADVEALRQATRADRCDWRIDYEEGPPLFNVRAPTDLLILTGHERALAGQPREAAERYLDALRVGADVGDDSLVHAMISVAVVYQAGTALQHLLDTRTLARDDIVEIERELDLLAPALPTSARAFRGERLLALWQLVKIGEGREEGALEGRVGRPVAAAVWGAFDGWWRAAEAAAALDDKDARKAAFATVKTDMESSWKRFAVGHLTDFALADGSARQGLARVSVVRAAAAVERFRLEHGTFPAKLEEAMPVPPRDPCANGPVQYQRADDGRSVQIWSAGAAKCDLGKGR
jgi:hypothetical protein